MNSHAQTVARWFGLPADGARGPEVVDGAAVVVPTAGEVVLITGASGSGKSTWLRRMRAEAVRAGHPILDLAGIALPDRPTVDVLGVGLAETLSWLSLVGLAEAHTYLRPPATLSEGQRWRLRLAAGLARAVRHGGGNGVVVAADEFGTLLDRVTALALCRALRRATRQGTCARIGFALATSHGDVIGALDPDVIVRCDFGTHSVKRRRATRPPKQRS